MTVFVAFLRGINVGGHRKMKMADLRELCGGLGWHSVHTILQSGNVVFTAEEETQTLIAMLEKAIKDTFGQDVRVLMQDAEALDEAMKAMPFPLDDGRNLSHVLITFLDSQPKDAGWETLCGAYGGPEVMHLEGQQLYLFYPNGIGRSKLTNAYVEKKLGVSGTARNWKTLLKIKTVIEQISES